MSRIAEAFKALRLQRRRALIPFVVAGDPDLDSTLQIVQALAREGADLVELGVPFSDPIADGPVNQRAAQRALAAGVTLTDVLGLVRKAREVVQQPIVLLSYYNPILQYGLTRFCTDAAAIGVDGVVIPDLPPDESEELMAAARSRGLDVIFLLAPTSTNERINFVTERASGFIYCVSLTGVTGVRDRLSEDIRNLVVRIKARTEFPVCVGFGISTADQAREIAEFADGVIVGSAIVALLESPSDRIGRLSRFVQDLRQALDTVRVGEPRPL
jgi:tryptophan synthase alpha chain